MYRAYANYNTMNRGRRMITNVLRSDYSNVGNSKK